MQKSTLKITKEKFLKGKRGFAMKRNLKKRVISFILFFVMILGLTPIISLPVNAKNNGFLIEPTKDAVPINAIHIKTATELAAIGGEQSEGKYYVLDNDINLSDEWVPVDDFRGTFNGQGHSISNLYVLESSNRKYAGLFGSVIGNVKITDIAVNIGKQGINASSNNSEFYAGGLIGYIYGSNTTVTIENCYTTGNINASSSSSYGRAYAGGLIGSTYPYYSNFATPIITITIENCYTTGNVSALSSSSDACAGGLVARVEDIRITINNSYATGYISSSYEAGGLVGVGGAWTTIKNCYSTGDVFSYCLAGGLICTAVGTVIENCYAKGDITVANYDSSGYAGGLIGTCTGVAYISMSNRYSVIITNCYATGNVSASSSSLSTDTYAGGLIGYTYNASSASIKIVITNCYSKGNITVSASTPYAGGLIGYESNNLTLTGNYRYSTQIIQRLDENRNYVGGATNEIGTPLTDAQMKDKSSFNGWNFDTVWGINSDINNGYPYLTRVSQIAKGKAKKWRKMEKKRLKSVLPNKIIKIYN